MPQKTKVRAEGSVSDQGLTRPVPFDTGKPSALTSIFSDTHFWPLYSDEYTIPVLPPLFKQKATLFYCRSTFQRHRLHTGAFHLQRLEYLGSAQEVRMLPALAPKSVPVFSADQKPAVMLSRHKQPRHGAMSAHLPRFTPALIGAHQKAPVYRDNR